MKQQEQKGKGESVKGRRPETVAERILGMEIHSGMTVRAIQEALTREEEMVYIEGFVKGLPSWYRDERTKGEWEMIRVNPDGSEDLIFYEEKSGTDREIVPLALPGEGKMAYLFQDPRYTLYKKAWEGDGN